jgi:hypothetical protein
MHVHLTKYDDTVYFASGRWKNLLFTAIVTAAFALGLYSLFLASANAGKVRPSNITRFTRTATSADDEKIETALGNEAEQELIFAVLYSEEIGLDPKLELAALRAARILTDSGVLVQVRLLHPADADFTKIVEQNGIVRFPAVLVVKKGGGIVLVTDEINEKNLLHAYQAIWGKISSCEDAKSAIY